MHGSRILMLLLLKYTFLCWLDGGNYGRTERTKEEVFIVHHRQR